MADRPRHFPVAEYRRRVTVLQREMAARDLHALLLTTPPDVCYVTGFLTRFWDSPARPWFVVVPASGDPVAVIPAIGAVLMRRTWLTDIRLWDAPDPADDGVTLLTDTLAELVPASGRIGLPMGLETHLRMPLADYHRLAARLAPRAFVDGTAALHRVREIKSEAEIARLRATCAVADAAFARVPDMARAGQPLAQVFRAFQVALLEEGADWVAYIAGGAGPEGYDDVISPADSRPLAPGDILMLDTGAVRDGYYCDFCRNYALGRPSDPVRRAQAALFEATEETLARIRPGMTAASVHAGLTDTIRRHGCVPAGGRLGHGLGLSLTEWPSLSAKDGTPLRAGMVLTLEPGVEVAPGRFLVHEEDFVLRETGAELLSTRAPAALPELPA